MRLNREEERAIDVIKKVFERAGKQHCLGILRHFAKRKRGGWPLDYTIVVEALFYDVFNVHLESFLMPKVLAKKGTQLINAGNRLYICKQGRYSSKGGEKDFFVLYRGLKRACSRPKSATGRKKKSMKVAMKGD